MSDQLSADLASLRIPRDEDQPRGPWLRWLVLALVLGAVGVAIALYVVPAVQSAIFKTEVSFTEVALISPSQASTDLTATGYVQPQVLSHVAAKIPARVARSAVREGDTVKAGQLLFQLEDADLRSAIAAASSRVAAARARAQTARANRAEIQLQLERTQKLVEKGAAARSAVEDLAVRLTSLEEAAKAADAEARVAAAEVDTLEVNLRYATVRAPISGTVISRPPEVGDLVGPGNGPLLDLADFSSLVVEAEVPEARLQVIRVGGPCEIVLDAFPGTRYRGAVSEIGRRVNRAKATVVVKVRFVDPAKDVLPDMAARVSFLSKALDAGAAKEAPKVVVPASAIAERGGGKVVFVLEGTLVRMVPVSLGPAFGGGFEVKLGPAAGARVVKNPSPALADGQKVKERTD